MRSNPEILFEIDILKDNKDKNEFIQRIVTNMQLYRESTKCGKDKCKVMVQHTISGSPTIVCGNSNYNISISHYKKYTAIAISDFYLPIGIDIDGKKLSEQTYSVFMSKHEINILEENELNALLLWCGKESIAKLLRTGVFFINLNILEINEILLLEDGIYQIEYSNFQNICTIVSDKLDIIIAISFFKNDIVIHRILNVLKNI